MAVTVNFVGYMHAPGRNSFMRVFALAFNATYAQNNAEVVNLALANNPFGIENPAIPVTASPLIDLLILGSTLNGWKPELQIGGNGVAGQYGITFWANAVQMASATAYSADFPANTKAYLPSGTWYGQVLIGILGT